MIFQGGRLLRVGSRFARSAQRFIRAITAHRSVLPWSQFPTSAFFQLKWWEGLFPTTIEPCFSELLVSDMPTIRSGGFAHGARSAFVVTNDNSAALAWANNG